MKKYSKVGSDNIAEKAKKKKTRDSQYCSVHAPLTHIVHIPGVSIVD